MCLRRWTRTSIIFKLSIRFWLPSNRHVRQARVIRKAALRQEPAGHSPGETSLRDQPWSLRLNSLRHVPLRGTGWSRNPSVSGCKPAGLRASPTSFGFARRNRNQRVRRRTENSENTPSLLHKNGFSARELALRGVCSDFAKSRSLRLRLRKIAT
jgi:hypothetical protein